MSAGMADFASRMASHNAYADAAAASTADPDLASYGHAAVRALRVLRGTRGWPPRHAAAGGLLRRQADGRCAPGPRLPES